MRHGTPVMLAVVTRPEASVWQRRSTYKPTYTTLLDGRRVLAPVPLAQRCRAGEQPGTSMRACIQPNAPRAMHAHRVKQRGGAGCPRRGVLVAEQRTFFSNMFWSVSSLKLTTYARGVQCRVTSPSILGTCASQNTR